MRGQGTELVPGMVIGMVMSTYYRPEYLNGIVVGWSCGVVLVEFYALKGDTFGALFVGFDVSELLASPSLIVIVQYCSHLLQKLNLQL